MTAARVLLLAGLALTCNAFRQDPSGGDRPSYADWKEGKANESATAAAKAARSAKMAAVNKVTTLLEDLFAKVSAEAEKESGTYNKTMMFCEDTTTEKNAAITSGMDREASLTTKLEELKTKLEELETTISGLLGDIEMAEDEKKEAMAKRGKELKLFEKNSADLIDAIRSLEGALKTLKASKEPALVQVQSLSKTVEKASILADALGLANAEHFAFLQQAPEVQMENYKYHSDKIISMLEKLLDDFREVKASIDAEEVKSVAAHDLLMQEKETLLKAKNTELDEARRSQAEAKDKRAGAKQELAVTEGDLAADREYLDKLTQMCSDITKTYKQRKSARDDELAALNAAISIVSESVAGNTSAKTARLIQQSAGVRLAHINARNPAALAAMEEEAEAVDAGMTPSLLQEVKSTQPDNAAQEAVASMLLASGAKIKSALLTSLASKLKGDPLGKVKQMIEDLIQKLLNEAAQEQSQKGFCDKSTMEAKQKRTLSSQAIERLNGEMMELEARRDELTEDLATLTREIADLTDELNKANDLRKEENRENEATVMEAQAGLDATESAIQVLDRYYKTVDDAKVDLSAEEPEVLNLIQQTPMEDAPNAGFKIGEAYQGSQGEASGIIGMLEVIASDFKRTVKTTLAQEEAARQDHVAFQTQTGASLAEKNAALEHKSAFKETTETELATATSDMDAQSTKLQGAIRELLDLKPVCVDTGMSYEERVAMREDEIEALKKALCILANYAEYGPGGGGSC